MTESDRKVMAELVYKVSEPAEKSSAKLNPVIFLHAMLCSKEIWVDIPQRVADATKRTVYTYDSRNHGENDHTEDYTFDLNVSDLFRFMDGLNLQEVVLVGHDMGGITAIRAALENSSRVEMVFIIDMYVKELPDKLIDESNEFMAAWSKALGTIEKNTPVEEVTRTVVPILFENIPKTEAKRKMQECEKKAYMKANFIYKKSDEGYKFCFNEGALTKALAKLKESQKKYEGAYDKPAYFFYGAGSHYEVGSEGKTIEKHFPKYEMLKFDEASHFLFVDFPDKFVCELVSRLPQRNDS